MAYLKLTPFAEECERTLPKDSADRGVNFPVSHFLTVATNYTDVKFDAESPKGLPLVGKVAQCNGVTAKAREASLSLGKRRKGLPARKK